MWAGNGRSSREGMERTRGEKDGTNPRGGGLEIGTWGRTEMVKWGETGRTRGV